MSVDEIHELTGIDPWFLENLQEIVEMEDAAARGSAACERATTPRCAGPSSSASPTGSWPRSGARPRWTSAHERKRRGHRGHVQVGRHLRRRVRGLHALLLFDLRGRGRNAAEDSRAASGSMILGGGPEPHRPGHRVRLLLLPRQLRPARAGHRVDHGQLEPRDRLAPTTTPATCCSSSR